MLPGPTHYCFDYAEWDNRIYEFLDDFKQDGAKPGMFLTRHFILGVTSLSER
jgi:hypothetical protein